MAALLVLAVPQVQVLAQAQEVLSRLSLLSLSLLLRQSQLSEQKDELVLLLF